MKSITKAQKAISDFDKQIGGMDNNISKVKSKLAESLTIPSANFEDIVSSFLPADLVSSIEEIGNVIENIKSSYSSVSGKFSGVADYFSKLGKDDESEGKSKDNKKNTETEESESKLAALQTHTKEVSNQTKTSLSNILKNVRTFVPAFIKGISIAAGISLVIAEMGLLQESFGTQIQNLLLQIQTTGPSLITNLCNGISGAVPNIMTQGMTLMTSLLDTITILLPSIINGGMKIISSFISGIAMSMPTLIPSAMLMIVTLVTGLLANMPRLVNSGLQMIIGIVQGLMNSIPVLIAYIPTIIISIINTFIDYFPSIIQTGVQILQMVLNGMMGALPVLVQKLPMFVDMIRDSFENTDWCQIGKDILKSVIDGLESMLGNLWNTVKNIVSGIVKSFSFSFTSDGKMKSGSVPHLAHGTDYWSGGFAYMNEGGRGELTYLPNGSQVIPHDISVKYAKEAARANTANSYTDLNGLGNYIVAAVAETSQIYAQKLAEGISGMRMTVNNREAARFVADLGFVRR